MTLQTVLVADEQLGRELLMRLLADHPDIEIVAQCKNGREAIEHLKIHPIDLLLLDIQMPAIGGFDVVEQIGLTHLPPTIFVTAYHEHAVRAFEVQAIDYLTKPVDPQRLETALSRVREKVAAKTALLTQAQFAALLAGLLGTDARNAAVPDNTERLLIKDGEKEILLPVEKVDWIEAAEYYCCIHSRGRRYMLRETLSDLADRLNSKQFVRIHRSSIVSIDQIKAIYRDGKEDGSVSLLDGRNLRMSKTGRRRLLGHSID